MYADVPAHGSTINQHQGTYSHLNREVTNSTAQNNETAPVYSSLALTTTHVNEYGIQSNYSVITRDELNDATETINYGAQDAASVYSTVVRQEGKKVTAKLLVEDSEGEATASNVHHIKEVSVKLDVKTGDETDYFDDADMLEQIRAQKN